MNEHSRTNPDAPAMQPARRDWLRCMRALALASTLPAGAALTACATGQPTSPLGQLRGTGDLGIIIERADGAVQIISTTERQVLGRITGLGDLSHASAVFSRDARHGYVFGRDGGLSRIDLLTGRLQGRIIQSGNAIGGSISQDGRVIAVANYSPGGIRLFDAHTLEPLSEVAAISGPAGQRSKVVGLADIPGQRFVYSLYDSDAIWLTDVSDPRRPHTRRFESVGRMPYDGLVTPDGRWYVAGLFGEPGIAVIDLWHPEAGVRKVLDTWTHDPQLPVYKMPHLRGWAQAGRHLYLPAIGRHEVWQVDMEHWQVTRRIPVRGQPVFAMARPDGKQIWVNFAFPDNGRMDVIGVPEGRVIRELEPGRAVLHLEFTPRGEQVWLSARDDNRVVVIDTERFETLAQMDSRSPSGIFFTARAGRTGL